MIPTKTRESRRVKAFKLPKNLERLYKEGKCRECAVVVTRMDFAKILGKFTKVKIQYESNTTPKTKQYTDSTSPNSNARLKSNENGMVLIHRKTYSQHPVKELLNSKKTKKNNDTPAPIAANILKENNRLKKPIIKDKTSNYNNQKPRNDSNLKQYGIVFEDPSVNNNNNNDFNCKISLSDLLPHIDESILPSEEWCIDYFPKKDEPKDDQVYDRIAAELEDLMYNDKPIIKLEEKPEITENKVDDFPSIMDILNDNSSENKTNNQSNSLEFKSNLESSDVEAMLLGKPNPTCESVASVDISPRSMDIAPAPVEIAPTSMDIATTPVDIVTTNLDISTTPVDITTTSMEITPTPIDIGSPPMDIEPPPMDIEPPPMDIDNTSVGNLIEDVHQLSTIQDTISNDEGPATNSEDSLPTPVVPEEIENPHSPSILDEALQKGIEEHLPIKQFEPSPEKSTNETTEKLKSTESDTEIKEEIKVTDTNVDSENSKSNENINKERNFFALKDDITHIVFKKTKEGACFKSVTCPKNLKYCIEMQEKSVEFIGAPKYIKSLEDLQVLLQIVNESELDNLHVLH